MAWPSAVELGLKFGVLLRTVPEFRREGLAKFLGFAAPTQDSSIFGRNFRWFSHQRQQRCLKYRRVAAISAAPAK
jgi:hypothetical protein